jgi:hypothetical protein
MPILAADIKFYLTKSTASADGESGGNGLGKYRSSDQIITNTDENLFDDISSAESAAGDTEYRAFMVKNTHATLSLISAKVFLSSNSPFSDLTTQLTAGGSETTVAVTSTADFPSSGSFFCEDEEITYTGKTSNSFIGCTRGSNSTSKSLHTVGTYCEHNQFRIAVEAPSNKSTGYIQLISDESTAPSSPTLTWTANYTFATGLSIGTLAAGEFYGIWTRRKVPLGAGPVSGIYYTVDCKGETAG